MRATISIIVDQEHREAVIEFARSNSYVVEVCAGPTDDWDLIIYIELPFNGGFAQISDFVDNLRTNPGVDKRVSMDMRST